MNKQFKIWPVLRDVIIVAVLTGLGGFIVGLASTDHSSRHYFYSLAVSNGLFCIIGFTNSGCLAVGNRWRHLAFVAVASWAISILNVVFFGVTITMWLGSAIAIAFFMSVGGCLSFVFKKKTMEEEKLEQAHNQHSSADGAPSNSRDDKFYDEVARELQEKSIVAGLWTKAYAEMDGDDARARALYIKYRVAQLKETKRRRLEEERVKWEAMEAAERQQRDAERATKQ